MGLPREVSRDLQNVVFRSHLYERKGVALNHLLLVDLLVGQDQGPLLEAILEAEVTLPGETQDLGLREGPTIVVPLLGVHTVRYDRSQQNLILKNAPPSNVIGIFGLSPRTKEEDLRAEFEKYGDLEKVVWTFAFTNQPRLPLFMTNGLVNPNASVSFIFGAWKML